MTAGAPESHQIFLVDLGMCESVVEAVIHKMVKGIAPRYDLPNIRAITHGRFMDVCRLKCPEPGIPETIMCQRVPHMVFRVSMD